MGRSVSYANNSRIVVFQEIAEEDCDDFDFFLANIQDSVCERWPSFYPCSKWLGREDHAVVENQLGYIGVSTYGNLASIWFAPKDDYPELADHFADQITPRFEKTFGSLNKVGTFSNGESVFSVK